MSRISSVLNAMSEHAADRTKALIPYITVGDPYKDITVELMHTLVQAGADIIELGVPFSDPMADGPVIQRASERALAKGINLAAVFDTVQAFRQTNSHTPVVLMGYANPVEHYDGLHGKGAFAEHASVAGADGILIVDYPPEESIEFSKQLRSYGLDQIFLLAPTSTPQRIKLVGELASGYVYYVSLKGVTGAATLDTASVSAFMPRLKKDIHTPVCVGFGIRDAASAKAVAQVCDGVIIGSRLIELIEKQPRDQVLAVAHRFISELRHAIDAIDKEGRA